MKLIADLHVHSKYSRATSPQMDLFGLEKWACYKGIQVVGTGDFTHPEYLKHLKENLKEARDGLYRLKTARDSPVLFLPTAEISLIYKDGERTRKIHHLLLAPSLQAAAKIGRKMAQVGNVASDGRPIFGMSSRDLVKLVLDQAPAAMIIPAHAWTPWFSVFGSKSGYDSLQECFGPEVKHIHAIETGLSSDRPMNRRCSMLDKITLVSNSDAHSPAKLGREANVLNCELSYPAMAEAIASGTPDKFPQTIEFFPEEGKYHYDGHRECKVCQHPRQTREKGGRCPVCFKPLTLGVMNRCEELADKPWDYQEETGVVQQRIIPLEEIIADVFDCGAGTKKVRQEYLRLLARGGSEFAILLDLPLGELKSFCPPRLVEGIERMRQGKIYVAPGYDGVFGTISALHPLEEKFETRGLVQMKLL